MPKNQKNQNDVQVAKQSQPQEVTKTSGSEVNSSVAVFEQIDQLIKSGQVSSAAQRIVHLIQSQKTFVQKLRPEERLTLGNLARRAGMALTSLKILRPVIRALREGIGQVTDAEKVAYAAGLIALGALSEAETLLAQVNESETPEAFLFLGLGMFSQWRYGDGIVPLRRYIAASQISPYQKWVGRLNLSAALLVEQKWAEAERLISSCLQELLDTPHVLLRAFFEEQRVQLLIEQKKIPEAAHCLQQIRTSFPQQSPAYQLTLLKWQTVIEWSQGELTVTQMQERLEHLAEKAREMKLWEILREVDFYRALFLHDSKSFQKIICGTPWPSYLERLRRSFVQNRSFSSLRGLQRHKQFEYLWSPRWSPKLGSGRAPLQEESSPHLVSLDRLSGLLVDTSLQKKQRIFKFDSLVHRLFFYLTADFYKPMSLGYLFSQLYPGEFFNPFSSPQRVQQLVHRLNRKIQPLGFKVQSKRNVFFLEGPGVVHTVKNFGSTRAKWGQDVMSLKACFFWSRFSAMKISNADLQLSLGVDEAKARRILLEGAQEGVLIARGERGQRHYLVCAKSRRRTSRA